MTPDIQAAAERYRTGNYGSPIRRGSVQDIMREAEDQRLLARAYLDDLDARAAQAAADAEPVTEEWLRQCGFVPVEGMKKWFHHAQADIEVRLGFDGLKTRMRADIESLRDITVGQVRKLAEVLGIKLEAK